MGSGWLSALQKGFTPNADALDLGLALAAGLLDGFLHRLDRGRRSRQPLGVATADAFDDAIG
jgi:hypothetical protein